MIFDVKSVSGMTRRILIITQNDLVRRISKFPFLNCVVKIGRDTFNKKW